MASDINEADSEENDSEEDDFTMKPHRLPKRNFSILSSNSYSRKNPKNSKKASTSDSDQSTNRDFQSDNEPIDIDPRLVPKVESTSHVKEIDNVFTPLSAAKNVDTVVTPLSAAKNVQVSNSILHSVETNQFGNQKPKNY